MEMNNNYFGYYIINNKLYRNTDNENILFSEYVENSYIGYDYLFKKTAPKQLLILEKKIIKIR